MDGGVPFYPNDIWKLVHGNEQPSGSWICAYHMTPTCFERMVHKFQEDCWLRNREQCRGVFVMSEYAAKAARYYLDVPVNVLRLPTDSPKIEFNPNALDSSPRLLFIGHWLRRFDRYYALRSCYSKLLLDCMGSQGRAGIEQISYVTNEEYDSLLASNIVFADFIDSSCNNVVVECIVRNTPILVPPIESVMEYLGKDYPLYFNSTEEAEAKLGDEGCLMSGYEYLKGMSKTPFTYEGCLKSFVRSEIYRSIEVGAST